MLIDGIKITAEGFNPDAAELKNYVDYCREHVTEPFDTITVTLCPDGKVDVNWAAHNPKFERIRRITGYLVGTIDRWNNAKQAEERERVKHL